MVVVVDLLRKVQSLEPVVFYVSGQGPMAHWNREHSTDQAPKVNTIGCVQLCNRTTEIVR